jgi:3-dehydroquinate synthase
VTTVQVMLGDRTYPIRIRPGSLVDLGEALESERQRSRVIVVSSPRVIEAHMGAVRTGMARAHLDIDLISVPDGERAKTLRMASKLYDELLELGAERQSWIVALGGGSVSDLAGFVASTFLRGLPWVAVPTTLLGQVDASVGGKTAVNHGRGKNLIGTFYQPRWVWVDTDLLATLPPREFRCGMAEVIKVAAVWDARFFEWLEDHMEAVMAMDREALAEAIGRAIAIKAEVVGLDEREGGLRALLNLGHTLAHGVEAVVSPRKVRHGEAVAMGMVFAARISQAHGLIGPEVTERLVQLLHRAGLPTTAPDWKDQKDAYLRAIAVDKKVAGDKVGFVVLKQIGSAEVLWLTPAQILEAGA